MKRALITGGSGDIGAAICHRLASDNVHVIVHANTRPQRAEEVCQAIRVAGGSSESCIFDVTDRGACETLLNELSAAEPIQIIINNAAINHDAPLAGMDFDDWQGVFDVAVNGFFNVTRPLLIPMIRSRWGRIVNMSSLAALAGNRGQVNYAAAKSALHGASKSLAIELASRGITVNAVAPGVIAGEMSAASFPKEKIKQLVPMGRAGKPEEVAALVGFLCSDAAAYISGQIISINGAMYC